ncbi:MAG: hypothetical protein FWE23_00655 [Chitinivibrionia bacterium]|nr:hypothetical protein [Chitinivibrionia bacterium]
MKNITTIIFALMAFALSFAENVAPDKLEVHFFGSNTCMECHELKHRIFAPLIALHSDSLEFSKFDLDNPQNIEKLMQYDYYFGVQNPSPITLFFADTFLTGFEDISRLSHKMITERLGNREKWRPIILGETADIEDLIQARVDAFGFWAITFAGLADGINPCAIATMIFLISFLTLKKRRKTEVLLIGLLYTATVFITYFSLGLGAFKLLNHLGRFTIVSQIIGWAGVAFATLVGLLSLFDAIKHALGKKSEEMTLQLPKSVKKSIHKVISKNLNSRHLVIGTVITGFLVTIFEAACTGQTYLPTIILMTHHESFRTQGIMWLLYYNFLFVLPLLFVMVAAYFGLTWERLSTITQKHLALLKVIVGLVMLGIAAYLGLSLKSALGIG